MDGVLSLPSWAQLSAVAVASLPGRDGGAGAGGAAGSAAQALAGAPLSGPLADPWAGAESLVCLAGGQGSLGTHNRVRWKASLQELGHRLLNPLGLIQHQSKYPQGASSSLRPVGELQVGIGFRSTCEEGGLQATSHAPFCLLMARTEPSDWKHGVFLQNACPLAWG